MIPQKRSIFCIIVHYGAVHTTDQLITSLLGGQVPPEMIIVVNHGPERTQMRYADEQVQLVTPERNEGYAAGINIGLGVLKAHGVSPSDIVVCTNNDVEITSTTIQQVRRWWEKNPQPALAGIKGGVVNLFTGRATLLRSETFQNSQRFPKLTNRLVFFGKVWNSLVGFLSPQLRYVHGSFLTAPLTVFMKVHFPDTYFLYWEDVAFSRRLHKAGVPLKVLSGVDMRHAEEKALTEERLYYLVRNGAHFLEHEAPLPWRVWWRVLNRLRSVYHAWMTPEPKRFHMLRALGDARRNVTGKYEPQ